MEKVWIVTEEYNNDCDHIITTFVCSSLEKAKEVLNERKNKLFSKGEHWEEYDEETEEAEIEENENSFSIHDNYDYGSCDINIEEKEIL